MDCNMSDGIETDFGRLVDSEIISVYVGPKRRQWLLHKALLCQAAEHLKSALDVDSGNNTTTKKSRTLYLTADDPDAFELFVNWLYRRSLPSLPSQKGAGPFLRLYILAVKFGSEDLQNEAINRLHRYSLTQGRQIDFIYAHSAEDSPLRSLLTHKVAHVCLMQPGVTDEVETAMLRHSKLAVGVLRIMLGHSDQDAALQAVKSKLEKKCHFHRHDKTAACGAAGAKAASPDGGE